MLKLTIDQNSITRELGFDLRFHAPVSYEEFCGSKEYEDFASSYGNASGRFKIMLHLEAFYRRLGCEKLNGNNIIMLDFRENSYIEEYQNIFDLNMLVGYPEEPIQNRRHGIEDMDHFEIDLNYIKYFITDNKFYYQCFNDAKKESNNDGKRKSVKIFNHTKKTIEGFYNGDYDLKRSNIKKLLKFTQIQKKNNYLQYIFFLNVVTNLNLFIVINPYRHSYIITDSDGLVENSGSTSIIINIRDILNKQLSSRLLKHAIAIRERYKKINGNTIKQVMRDIQEAIKTNANLKIKLNVNKGDINYVDTEFRDQDLSKYHYLKNIISNSDTSHISIENHKGKPSAVVGHTRKRYDK